MPPTRRTRADVILVTGASSGIGRATALRAAAAGRHVVLAARDDATLRDAAADCADAGAASTLAVPTDVGDDEQVRACVGKAVAELGRLDAVVSAAGVAAYGRTEELPVDVFDTVLRTNLIGSVNLTRHVLPVLRRQRAGTLLYVGSVLGHIAVPTMSAYVLSKWGVRALARQVALENRDLPGVRIRYAAPGGVETAIYDQAAHYTGHPAHPPPPVALAGHVAAQLLRRLGPVPLPHQLSPVNHVMTAGFTLLPRVYDASVGVLFSLLGTDLTSTVDEGPGNVLGPLSGESRPGGDHGSPWGRLTRNLRVRLDGPPR